MPVFLFTFHAFRSWRPDHPKGYVRRVEGVLPPDPEMAERYDRHANQPVVAFELEHQMILRDGVLEICSRRAWRVHAVSVDRTHVHTLISWHDESVPSTHVNDTLKRLLGMMLAQQTGLRDRKWFSRGSSRRHVRDRAHFEHLIRTYLREHRGIVWIEEDVKNGE